MKVSRRRSLEDLLCVGVLPKVMDRRAVRVQSKTKEKEKSPSALGKVIPFILQMGREPSAQERSPAVSAGPRAQLAQGEEQPVLLAAEGP